jgi:hypothetical protein
MDPLELMRIVFLDNRFVIMVFAKIVREIYIVRTLVVQIVRKMDVVKIAVLTYLEVRFVVLLMEEASPLPQFSMPMISHFVTLTRKFVKLLATVTHFVLKRVDPMLSLEVLTVKLTELVMIVQAMREIAEVLMEEKYPDKRRVTQTLIFVKRRRACRKLDPG